jgi:hypothetical protein
MLKRLELLVVCATAMPVSATTLKEFELVTLDPNHLTATGWSWQDKLRTAMTKLRPRCATTIDDLMAVIEIVSSESTSSASPDTKPAADYLATEGLRHSSIYEGQISLKELQSKSKYPSGAEMLRVGAIRVELVCTSGR